MIKCGICEHRRPLQISHWELDDEGRAVKVCVHCEEVLRKQACEYKQISLWTQNLSRQQDLVLNISIPMSCGADSVDMETFLLDEWAREVRGEDLGQITVEFCVWYRKQVFTCPGD